LAIDKVNIFWFRRDLRLKDNRGLYKSLMSDLPVICIFIFDKNILSELEKNDSRVTFIHQTLEDLNEDIQEAGSHLKVFHDEPESAFESILNDKSFQVQKVFTNHDYEPYGVERDSRVEKLLKKNDVEFETFKDQVIFEKSEVVKDDGDPYVVFTPYKRKWLEALKRRGQEAKPLRSEDHLGKLYQMKSNNILKLSDLGFEKSKIEIPTKMIQKKVLKNYKEDRDYPAKDGTTRLGLHLRFGTASIRRAVDVGKDFSDTWLSELIWREFYMQILWHYPHSAEKSFRQKYDDIKWRNDKSDFKAWSEGRTGYPLVDAGMRELVQTGYMHNRVRMLVASFLTKHLLINWKWGERFFAKHLLDFELASNVGGWQWAAGSGTDAAPYFRIFNPETQIKKFDKDQEYIKEYVPEIGTKDYPDPIVDHKEARQRCLDTYKEALK
jgi:deoxyribodipyrimidine photo-lyase